MKKTFPYLEVCGTHRDIGFAVGENFRDKIREYVSLNRETIPNFKELRSKSQNHFLETLRYFPQLIEELTATAISASVGVMDLFFLNTRSLYDAGISSELGETVVHEEFTHDLTVRESSPSDKCTTIASFNDEGVIVGHNEDWAPEYADYLYLLKATVEDTTFFGLNYAYELPGTSAAMNNWGLVQGINEVHQKEKVGIPKNFLARAALECKTIGEAITMVCRSDQDTGYNHVFVQKDKLANVEIAGGETDITINKDRSYVHTNHFLSDLVKYETYHTKSSEHRFNRATELLKINMSEKQIVEVLSDHADTEFPICRHDATLASLIFKPSVGEIKVCYGPPCNGEFIKYTI
jgi:hypothetical protein